MYMILPDGHLVSPHIDCSFLNQMESERCSHWLSNTASIVLPWEQNTIMSFIVIKLVTYLCYCMAVVGRITLTSEHVLNISPSVLGPFQKKFTPFNCFHNSANQWECVSPTRSTETCPSCRSYGTSSLSWSDPRGNTWTRPELLKFWRMLSSPVSYNR